VRKNYVKMSEGYSHIHITTVMSSAITTTRHNNGKMYDAHYVMKH